MSGSRSRRKGAAFERLVGHAFESIYPDACRGVGQTQRGSTCADVEGTEFWVECKCGQRPNLYAAIEQAREAKDERPILVVARKNAPHSHESPVDTATMLLSDFLNLLDRADSSK